MSKRGKRGVASFQKKYKEKDYHVKFDESNQPAGCKKSTFMSWVCARARRRFPYYLNTKNIEENRWEELWSDAKRRWNIETDESKTVVLRKAKKALTNFRSFLVVHYVRKEKLPLKYFKIFDAARWDEFVEEKTSDEFLAISEKAKISARANTNPARVGRSGYVGLEEKSGTIWPRLIEKYPDLKGLQDERSKNLIMGYCKKDHKTKLYELPSDSLEIVNALVLTERKMIKDGSYFEDNDDPIVSVFGREHGGRTRAVSEAIGSTKVLKGRFKGGRKRVRSGVRSGDSLDVNQKRVMQAQVDSTLSPGFCGTSASSGPTNVYPPIEKLTSCELLDPYELSDELTVAIGQIWPTPDMMLDEKLMHESCVRVQVDNVIEGCEKMHVLDVTKTEEIKRVGDMLHKFIQWPRDALKLLNNETPNNAASASRKASGQRYKGVLPQTQTNDVRANSYYYPEFEEDEPYQVQMASQHGHQGLMELLVEMHEPPQNLHQQKISTTDTLSTNAPEPDLPFIDPEVNVALERIKKRPVAIQSIVEQISSCMGDNPSIQFPSPDGMYSNTVVETIPYVELLQVFKNGWIDFTNIHWFEMYFYKLHNSHCAFLDPHCIEGGMCTKNPHGVETHILDVFTLHRDKRFFVAPYIANNHWTMFIICPSSEEGYIVDSINRGVSPHDYLLTSIIDDAFVMKFDWKMANCKQQKNGWECGFMVIKHMYEFVNSIQHDLPNRLWNEKGCLPQKEIDKLVLDLMPRLISDVFPGSTMSC